MGLFGGYPVPTSSFFVRKQTNLDESFRRRHIAIDVRELEAVDEFFLRGKSNGLELLPGDVFEGTTGGGGGYGDPLQREVTVVARDVALHYTSVKTAAEIYGVVLDASSAIDMDATVARRTKLLDARRRWAPAASRGEVDKTRTLATGEERRSVHEYVDARDVGDERVLACSACGKRLSDYRGNYKLGLLMHEGPVTLIPLVRDPSDVIDAQMVFRRFCCPGCYVLMATEIVRRTDPLVREMTFS